MSKVSLRRERFENVASKRVKKILDLVDTLSNCSNKNNYEYTQEDVRKMFKAIKERVNHAETLFQNELKKSSKNDFKF